MVATEYEMMKGVMKNRGSPVESGGFVLWKIASDMWYVELSIGGSKVYTGSNRKLVWHHTHWFGAHIEKGACRD
ncbi:hypothetical protein KFK09_026552 [Dendrobium nobile]|uniref:Uncharacterized protein n=1 Tax=Dendrobium nobile TaxID=94219 RepID=A0A8T3A918_DENNO|nr:hypothetical protein KFK09_026552 [Dendrobium nobile]